MTHVRPPHPVRLVVGLASLALDRIGATGDALPTAVGLAQAGARVARKGAEPLRWAARQPLLARPLRRGEALLADARDRGRITVAAGRADAMAFLKTGTDDMFDWLVPQLRARVVPPLVEDLTTDPQVRDLVVEQTRGVLGEAAASVRVHTESADNRVESAFRRLLRRDPVAP